MKATIRHTFDGLIIAAIFILCGLVMFPPEVDLDQFCYEEDYMHAACATIPSP